MSTLLLLAALTSAGVACRKPTVERPGAAQQARAASAHRPVVFDGGVFRKGPVCTAKCCADDYLALPGLAASHARPVDPATLDQGLIEYRKRGETTQVEALDGAALRATLVDALNVDFLLDGLEERPLTVSFADEDLAEGPLLEQLVRLTDPFIGTFEGILLRSRGAVGPRPAVVAVHGHNEDATDHVSRFHIREMARAGLVVFVPTMRVNGEGECESGTARTLMLAGFTLAGVRMYETLLVRKYLASRPDVDPRRIALVGHSGGAAIGNLTVRVAPGFAAYASDFFSDYSLIEEGPHGPLLLDETVPALGPHQAAVRDFATLEIPNLAIAYDAGRRRRGAAEIREFLVRVLAAETVVDSAP